jgi:hypothetical protein
MLISLSDSLLSARKGWGVHLRRLHDGSDRFLTVRCIASGCSLMMAWDGRIKCPESAISMAARALESRDPAVRRYLASDPVVRVVVVKAARSITWCREFEEFPKLVAARKRSRLISRHETPWSICDLEDVVQQRPRRKHRAEVEACRLRNKRGFFDNERDAYHFRKDIAKQAEDEILKAARRTGLERYGDGLRKGEVLMVIAAGWNVDEEGYSSLDVNGKAWLRADIIATAELCALHGHPVSAFRKKLQELARRRRGSHGTFLRQSIQSIRAKPPPKRRKRIYSTLSSSVAKHRRICKC